MDLLDGAALAVLVSLSVWYLKRFRLVTWMLRSLRMTVRLTCRTLRFTVRLCKRVAWLVAGASLIWISVAPRPEIIAGRVLVLSTLWGLWLYWRVQIHKAKGRQRAIAYRLPRRGEPNVSRYGQAGSTGELTADQGTDDSPDRPPSAPHDLEREGDLE